VQQVVVRLHRSAHPSGRLYVDKECDAQCLAGAGLLCGLNSSSRDIVILGVPNESAKTASMDV